MSGPNTPIRVPYKHVNGVGVPTDIHVPKAKSGTENGRAPVLIVLHGGGFMLGYSKMNSRDQIEDCLDRGWIVLSVEYRLCPGVNMLEGPMADARDVLRWAQTGGLAASLSSASSPIEPDSERVMAMGASAGGHLSLSLAWGVEKPPLAILDFYGPKHFDDPFWLEPIEAIRSKLPPAPPDSVFKNLYQEKETFIGGASLEGQGNVSPQGGPPPPDLSDKRQLFAMQAIANGKVLQSIWPAFPKDLHLVDPACNVHKAWPPTAIVHGNADFMVPMYLSQRFEVMLKSKGVETEFIEVDGEPHTFLGKMVKGSQTWYTQRKGFDFLEAVLKRSYGPTG